ncbi:GTPase Era [Corynebacterium caspium]|uniref:GTPase Era n=1 Tax=Corynebacterium caspium TaxID=234828 RepID=UPI00037966F8|nr:GTPase Era [Corynebacterium caspium]WKD58898.1 GTPase Era [Corynebacterium caspium DSM 44850]
MDFTATPEGFRSGFLSFVGRPNTGKSTLTNALVGQKIAITANQPETTRRPIRGVVHRAGSQIVIVDTPGMHKPRTLLGERLNDVVNDTYSDVDIIALTIPADEKIGPGDRWILDNLQRNARSKKIVGVVTKTDKVSRDQVAEQLMALHTLLGPDSDVVPVSANDAEQQEVLLKVIESYLPEGPKFYPDGHVTDESIEDRISELIREAALGGLREELPHSVAVQVDEILPNEDRADMLDVHAIIYVERPGQKHIIAGYRDRRMGAIVHKARPQIIELLGKNVFLDLRIKVLKNWQGDPKHLARLGF